MIPNTPNHDAGTPGDADVTRKMLGHIDDQVHHIGQQVAELTAVLDDFRPLLAALRRDGKPDLVGLASARRRIRRG